MKKGFARTALAAGFALAALDSGAQVSVDLSEQQGELNRWIHCSHWRPRYATAPKKQTWDAQNLAKLHFTAWRSHDAALVSAGQRVIDTHFLFPLPHLDPAKPENYFFAATDSLLRNVQEDCGMKVFYRLGSSIEHVRDGNAANTLDPPDHSRYAEALAGIVRHYTHGWGNGFNWDMRYWELFNEPDLPACWRGSREEFIDLFVTCLKRLKGEFPELKFGGPALAWVDEPFLRGLLAACKAGGVAPDFVSWHWYGIDPDEPARQAAQMREICRSCGFPEVELILDEWHFLAENNWNAIRGTSEEWLRTHTGPASMTGIDSAAFAMAVEAKLLDADVAQAYYYGCGFDWDWGYFDVLTRRYVKSFYAMQATGELFAGCTTRLKCASSDRAVTPLAALAADGRSATVLVADYRSGRERIEVAFAGAEGWRLDGVRILDDARDLAPVAAALDGGRLVLEKRDRLSACFAVRLVRD